MTTSNDIGNRVGGFADCAWGLASSSLADGRAWIDVPADCTTARQSGGGLLPRARAASGHQRFELPAAEAAEPGALCPFELELGFEDGSVQRLPKWRGIDIPRFAVDLNADEQSLQDLSHEQEFWLDAQSAIDRYVDAINLTWDEEAGESSGGGRTAGTLLLPFQRMVHRWEREVNSGDDARYALILRIAEQVSTLLAAVCRQPRVILRRKRAMERIDRVVQIDAGCIRWLVRQPGRTITEKAGREQRLLAVVRQEDSDTLENRVVRDFVVRAIHAADRYCFENRCFGPQRRGGSTDRFKTVQAFATLLRGLLKHTAIGQIPQLIGPPQPNYVLMFDPRYKVLWHWYQKLRRLQTEQEDVWRWRHRVWSEITLSTVLIAMNRIGRNTLGGVCLSEGHVYLRSDLQDGDASGRFILPESPLPVFAIPHRTDTGSFDISQVVLPNGRQNGGGVPESQDLRQLSLLNPDFVVTATDPRSQQAELLGVWTEFTPPTPDGRLARTRHLADRLPTNRVSGLIVQPRFDTGTADSERPFRSHVECVAVSLDPREAELQLRSALQAWISSRGPESLFGWRTA